MARRKAVRISDDDIKESGIKEDYYSNKRSNNGFIKISLNDRGAAMLNNTTEREIEEKRKELVTLTARRKELEKMESKLSKKSKKQRKKDKKKKKKDKKKMKNMPESSKILLGAIEEYKDKYHTKKKDKKNRDKYDGVTSRSKTSTKKEADPEAAERKKADRDKKDFDKRFEEPITLLRQTVIEVDKTLQDISELIVETKISRARNKSTMLKDLFSAKVGLLGNRTQNARGIGDLQKSKLDMELKKHKEDGGDQNEKNKNIALIAKAFPQLMGNSNRGPVPSGGGGKKGKKDKDKDEIIVNSGKKNKKSNKRKNTDGGDKLSKRASKLLKDGDMELTPHEIGIDIEGKFKIAVKKSFKDHTWEFTAIDNDGNEIRSFKDKNPGLLPKKKHHNLRFDDDRDICKCTKTDQVFQVIPVAYV